MKLLFLGATIALAGLGLLLAMVVRLLEPSLGLALLGYASGFVGLLLAALGAMQRLRS